MGVGDTDGEVLALVLASVEIDADAEALGEKLCVSEAVAD